MEFKSLYLLVELWLTIADLHLLPEVNYATLYSPWITEPSSISKCIHLGIITEPADVAFNYLVLNIYLQTYTTSTKLYRYIQPTGMNW